jgi:putative peptide zinc metalloprotease protein
VLVPAPYVDASTAWGFSNKWARIFVGAGGMIIELFVAAIMAFVWLNTSQGHLVHQLAYNAMLIASVSTILFNANPLLRYDGYYMLADWLEIPNLRYRSSEYSLGLIKRHLFKVKNPQPLPPVGQRIWLLVYAIASSIYRTLIGIFIILMVWNQVPVLGQLMALGGVATWVLMPIFKTVKYLAIEPELHRKRLPATAWVLAAAAAAVVLIGLIPAPMSLFATGVTEPVRQTTIHPYVAGIVERVVARDGQWLKQGDVILMCRDHELEAQIAETQANLESKKAEWRAAVVQDQSERQKALVDIAQLNTRLAQLKERQGALTIRAPQDGVLIAPHIEDTLGRYLKQTDEVATVADYRKLLVTTLVDQDDAALLFWPDIHKRESSPTQVNVHLVGQKSGDLRKLPILRGAIAKWVPVSTDKAPSPALTASGGGDAPADPSDPKGEKLQHRQFQIWVTLDNPGGQYLPGQRAFVRFEMDNRTLAWQWTRRIWQLIQSRANSKWI